MVVVSCLVPKVSGCSKGEKQDDLRELQGQVQAWAWWDSSGASGYWSNWDGSWCFQKPRQLKRISFFFGSYSIYYSWMVFSFLYTVSCNCDENLTPLHSISTWSVFCVFVTIQCFILYWKCPRGLCCVWILLCKDVSFKRLFSFSDRKSPYSVKLYIYSTYTTT